MHVVPPRWIMCPPTRGKVDGRAAVCVLAVHATARGQQHLSRLQGRRGTNWGDGSRGGGSKRTGQQSSTAGHSLLTVRHATEQIWRAALGSAACLPGCGWRPAAPPGPPAPRQWARGAAATCARHPALPKEGREGGSPGHGQPKASPSMHLSPPTGSCGILSRAALHGLQACPARCLGTTSCHPAAAARACHVEPGAVQELQHIQAALARRGVHRHLSRRPALLRGSGSGRGSGRAGWLEGMPR